MTDDNSNHVDMDNLDEFENVFFNKEPEKEPVKEKAPVDDGEESDEFEDDHLATDDDKDASEDEKPTEDADEDEEEKPREKPKSKTQKRIEKLLERERLANERASALENRLAALEASKKEVEHKSAEPAPLRGRLPADAPNPDAMDDKGNALYPLGEFDPLFIRDITKYSVNKELEAARDASVREAQTHQMNAARAQLQHAWADKMETVEEEIPDLREGIEDLVDAFQTLEPNYGEYLATMIMASDNGPQIMYYLSQNIGEAQKIVASGPAAATLAIGRLDTKLGREPEAKRNTKRVSDAPKPPESRVRGSSGKFSVSPDTDDLDAFERVFFQK